MLTHRIDMPEHAQELTGYLKLLTVRNPYTRLLSIWQWQMFLEASIHGMARCSFPDWFEQQPRGFMSIRSTITNELLEQVTNIIHLEHWAEDVQALPFTPDLVDKPRNRHASNYSKRDRIAYYTPGLLRRVADEYEADFVIGGYDPDAEFPIV
jgi:hypothetical protein